MTQVDARGDACPIPVVKTKEAISKLGTAGGTVKTLVDNEIAVQNLTKMANQKNWEVKSEKLGDNEFSVTMNVGAGGDAAVADIDESCIVKPAGAARKTVVVFDAGVVGDGIEKLGRVLLKSFTFALTKLDVPPTTIICYNGGAYMTCEGSEVLDDLKTLEAQGTEILTCGTCLDFYGLKEKLQVGTVTNMYAIAEKLMEADSVVHP